MQPQNKYNAKFIKKNKITTRPPPLTKIQTQVKKSPKSTSFNNKAIINHTNHNLNPNPISHMTPQNPRHRQIPKPTQNAKAQLTKHRSKTLFKRKRFDNKIQKKGYLAKRTIFREKGSNRFPVHFASGEMDKALVVLGTVFHLQSTKRRRIELKPSRFSVSHFQFEQVVS